ncbi:MAG: TraB/GumN family protein [Thiotrichales bacterium]|nr:TraB/GumN family protein [Thiotrichales bacterium]
MKYLTRIFIVLIVLLPVSAVAAVQQECRQFVIDESPVNIPSRYIEALLWKVTRNNLPPSYIYGTIHVSDSRVLSLPEPVKEAINQSTRFAMEAVPGAGDLLALHQLMFYSDESRLSDWLDEDKYNKAVEILNTYNMPDDSISRIKPWAAYLTMNYPSNNTLPLDLVLLKMARQKEMQIYGLETLTEQLSAFTSLKDREQIRILVDTLCNYDLVLHGFEEMISMYLKRDLQGLYAFSLRHSFPDDKVYENLYKKLLIDRNYLMVERLQDVLSEGQVFVAIGALHLSGTEGVLALLNKAGYTIEAIY